MTLLIRFTLLIILALGGAAAPALAQQAPAAGPASPSPAPAAAQSVPSNDVQDLIAEQRQAIESLSLQLDEIVRGINPETDDDERLVERRGQLEAIAEKALQAGVRFRPRLAEINGRLDQLGPPPAEGQPAEPEVVAAERKMLADEKAEINVLLGLAESASLRANREVSRITDMRRDLFTAALSKRYELGEVLNQGVLRDLVTEWERAQRIVSTWLKFSLSFRMPAVLWSLAVSLVVSAVIVIGSRRLFGRLIHPDPAATNPSYLSRLSVAFWTTLTRSLTFNAVMVAFIVVFEVNNLIRADVQPLVIAIASVASITYFVHTLSAAVLSPGLPSWRLLDIEPRPARRLLLLATITALVSGFDRQQDRISEALSSPLSVTMAKSFVATIIVGLLVLGIARLKPFAGRDGAGPRGWPLWLRYMLNVLGAGTILAALFGYIGMARFLSQQIVGTGAVLATAYVGFLSARALSDEGAFATSALGQRLEKRYGWSDTTLDQVGVGLSVLLMILVFAWAAPLILLQWGFQWADIGSWLYKAASGFTIGAIRISPMGVLSGLLVFALGYMLTRGFQGWLDGTVMARGKVDAGVRNSIRTAVGYAGLALAGLIAVSTAGIDLSNLALIAGALSLGVGFGLQNVVSNFVSGLILLAERPFKAGDWIVAGPVEGTVKRINVRATEIETFQRQTVILPNSELINSAVGNWTHKNKLGRAEVMVGVGYGSDVRLVHSILLDIARSHPLVLKNPEPFVVFANFGESSLDFEIRVFLADLAAGLTVRNDIRFAIVERFAEAGIEIPFPQRDLNVRAADGLLVRTEPAKVRKAGTRATHRPASETKSG